MQTTVEQRAPWWRSHLLRALAIGGLILLLQIPVALIAGLLSERQARRDTATAEIAEKWGAQQRILGPWLSVPYRERVTELDAAGNPRTFVRVNHAVFLPETLNIDGELEVETRYRGIFAIPVYRAHTRFEGSFAHPDLSGLVPEDAEVLWDQAHVSLLASDVRTIHGAVDLSWNESPLSFEPGAGAAEAGQPGIHAPIGRHLSASNYAFAFELDLGGSGALALAPVGEETRIDLRSPWSKPSFQGAWLPTQASVSDEGFEASWELGALGRGYPGAWTSDSPDRHVVEQNVIQVALLAPVDHYRMSERSVKYELLFLVLVFTIVWLFEVKARVRVHPIQYLLVGLALCTFYLLELALSEHIGFTGAYIIAGTMVVAMLGMYGASVLRRGWRGILLSGATGALYGYLYVVLMNEDYALLAGAFSVFGAVAIVMALTHRVDWYAAIGTDGEKRPEPTGP